MIRHAAAIAVVVCLSPSGLCAQTTQFTVSVVRANVRNGPSTASQVIGTASRGKVFKVTRELGSWVRISWPVAEDGVGYIHVSTGSLAHVALAPSNQTTVLTPSPRPAPESASPTTTALQVERSAPIQPPASVGTVSIARPAHLFGLGGRMGGSTLGFGGSARASVGKRFGIEFELSRYAPSSTVTQQRLTSLQFAPSLVYSLPDKLTDYLWLRPYVGAGMTVYRSTLSGGIPGGDSVVDTRWGRQVFGGTEVTFSAIPRFALSADYGYRWPQTPFDGFELGGRGLSVSGHWYLK
jgi:hypothetical protein